MKRRTLSLFLVLMTIFTVEVVAQSDEMVRVKGGTFMPFFNTHDDSVTVEPFYLDKYAVTNQEFIEFVEANPEWRRSRVKSVFADTAYLNHWAGDLDLGPDSEKLKHSPVTNISWFAARAYADWKGKRLPTLQEWEFAASASTEKPFAARDSSFVQKILDWYSQTNPDIHPPVGQQEPNYYGVHDMHGLVWEWVQDFNIVFLNGNTPTDQEEVDLFYCTGEGATATIDNYAAFLRYAFRSSLEADYSVGNLGFRLAADKN